MEQREWYDDLNTSMITLTGLLGCVIFVVLVIGVHALYQAYNSSLEAEFVAMAEPTRSNAILASQRRGLDMYRWANDERTKITIPVDRALDMVAEGIVKGNEDS